MAKKIILTDENGTAYTLEYTRNTIKQMEATGFTISGLSEKPVTAYPALFAGAFLAHHKYVKPDVIDKMFVRIGKKEELISTLIEMYSEPIVALISDSEGDEKNLEWVEA